MQLEDMTAPVLMLLTLCLCATARRAGPSRAAAKHPCCLHLSLSSANGSCGDEKGRGADWQSVSTKRLKRDADLMSCESVKLDKARSSSAKWRTCLWRFPAKTCSVATVDVEAAQTPA